jgi:hypothetical protein
MGVIAYVRMHGGVVRTAMLAMTIALAVGACGRGGDPDPAAQPGVGFTTGDQDADWAAIERLEGEARGIARTSGCEGAEQCATAPVGNRACGGPRYYLVYCSPTTDSAALSEKLLEIVRAEDEYNRRYEVVSTCEFRMPPDIAFSGGECRATTQQTRTP